MHGEAGSRNTSQAHLRTDLHQHGRTPVVLVLIAAARADHRLSHIRASPREVVATTASRSEQFPVLSHSKELSYKRRTPC